MSIHFVDADGMTIGGRHFGGLEEGDRVLFSKDGILVNGERRWDMPSK